MAAPAAPDPKDPTLRPFRGLAWGLYLLVAVGFSLMVTYSVTRSVWLMTPQRELPVDTVQLEPQLCRDLGRRLAGELEDRRRLMGGLDGSVAAFDARWAEFRLRWLKELRAAEVSCDVEREDRRALKRLFAKLEQLGDVYAIHGTQYASQVNPARQAFEDALAAER